MRQEPREKARNGADSTVVSSFAFALAELIGPLSQTAGLARCNVEPGAPGGFKVRPPRHSAELGSEARKFGANTLFSPARSLGKKRPLSAYSEFVAESLFWVPADCSSSATMDLRLLISVYR